MQKEVLTLKEATTLIFSQSNTVVSEVTKIPYMTVTSWKYRWNRGLLSVEKQKELVLKFGFKEVAEFRFSIN